MSQLDRLRAQLPPSDDYVLRRQAASPARTGEVSDATTRTDGTLPGQVRDLVRAVLDHMAAVYVEDDGEFIGRWENGFFDFGALVDTDGRADVLQVHAVWERFLPVEDHSAAALFANEWNSERVWPKVFARVEDQLVGLHTEVTVDLGPEPTLDQVDRVINTGIVSSLAVFDEAEAVFSQAQVISAEVDDE
ncbi:YbjN domain-containing protein [Jiangella asiatica]|uniref:YbjN domain-containing protein n=1 Tax=Jiangella asiatica TaxID=2530372 RepID=A0A4R5DKR6_9ACTN|nr:YbjN domain-containing protein [Jiangella asiatica]TDE12584.1 YbjN domain-containing protein [Jiangella asiatica]